MKRYIKKLLLLSLFVLCFSIYSAKLVSASGFPNDAITVNGASSSSTINILSVPAGATYTLFRLCVQSLGVSDVRFIINTNEVINTANSTKSVPVSQLQEKCIDGQWKLTSGSNRIQLTQTPSAVWQTYYYVYVPRDVSLNSNQDTLLSEIYTKVSSMNSQLFPFKEIGNVTAHDSITLLLTKVDDIGHYILIAIYLTIFFLFIRFLYRIFFYGI